MTVPTYQAIGGPQPTIDRVDVQVKLPDLTELLSVLEALPTRMPKAEIHVPPSPPPTIIVEAPHAPENHIHLPEAKVNVPAPVVNVAAPNVTIQPSNINIPAPAVHVTNNLEPVNLLVHLVGKDEINKLMWAIYCVVLLNFILIVILTKPMFKSLGW